MSQRHKDALAIQKGACNPSGIAITFLAGINECREEGAVPSEDAALRLIAHQLAFIMGTNQLDDAGPYDRLVAECVDKEYAK